MLVFVNWILNLFNSMDFLFLWLLILSSSINTRNEKACTVIIHNMNIIFLIVILCGIFIDVLLLLVSWNGASSVLLTSVDTVPVLIIRILVPVVLKCLTLFSEWIEVIDVHFKFLLTLSRVWLILLLSICLSTSSCFILRHLINWLDLRILIIVSHINRIGLVLFEFQIYYIFEE